MQTYFRKEDVSAVKVESIEGNLVNGEIVLNETFVSQNTFRVGNYIEFFNGQPVKVWNAPEFNATFELSDESFLEEMVMEDKGEGAKVEKVDLGDEAILAEVDRNAEMVDANGDPEALLD